MNKAGYLLILVCLCVSAWSQNPVQGLNKVSVRGKQQDVYFLPGNGNGQHATVLFAPGDGGWHGFAIDIARQMSWAGYDVFGLDTRRYLESFTGGTVLTTSQIASDFRDLAHWAQRGSPDKVFIVGWSEGAGLGLAAAADPANRNVFAGLVAVGMTEYNILAWRWSDLGAELLKTLPKEPNFKSADLIASVSPQPLAVISSLHDEYVSTEAVKKLFELAKEPKRIAFIDAGDHKFYGNTDAFFKSLKEAITWISQQQKK